MPLFSTTSSTSRPGPVSEGKTLPPHLQKVMWRVTEIATLPEVTARIVQVVEDPETTAHDIHDIVCTDPALAAKILKVVNSAFYGLPSQIASLDRAILMLGLSVVKNLALATSLSRLISSERISEHFEPRDMWRHCVAVGVCARAIARVTKAVPPDEAFVAGLMHDMGLIIIQQLFPKECSAVVDLCIRQPQNYCAAEESVIGADHQVFGSVLAGKWKFPPGLCHAIAYHHEPRSLQPEFQKITAAIYLADTLCAQGRFGFWVAAQTQQVEEWMLELLGLPADRLAEVTEDLPKHVEEAEAVFS